MVRDIQTPTVIQTLTVIQTNPLRHLTADPAAPTNNESWVRSDLAVPELRTRIAGVTKVIGGPVPEAWHEVGAAGEPAFQNAWLNYGVPYNTAAYYKTPDGMVVLKGLIKSGTIAESSATANIFILPVGYRPAAQMMLQVISNNGTTYVISRLDILATGEVRAVVGGNSFFGLDGAMFRAV